MDALEQTLAEIDLYGFAILEGVLGADEVAAMKAALVRCDLEVGAEHGHRGTARHVSNLPTLDPVFFSCIDHPHVLPCLERYLQPSLVLGSLNARILRPGDGHQELHGDIPEEMLNMTSPVMMNTVWMLDDFSPANGATRIVPGSHKSGLAEPPAGFDVKRIHQACAPAGSVLIFNGQCWHGGGANTSNERRHALFGHYRKHMLRFQFDPHDGFPPQWFGLLNARQKQLMRMSKGLGAARAADFDGL